MEPTALLQALHESWPAAALRRPGIAYPLVSAAHILALGTLVGAIATLDLRLLGLFRRYPLAHLAAPLTRMAAAGLALAIVTGLCLFIVRPAAYAQNPAFLLKLALVGAGLANALLLRALTRWREAVAGGAIGPAVRLMAALSLAIWAAAVLSGRWIAFI